MRPRHLLAVLLALCSSFRCLTAQVDPENRGVIRGIVLDTLGRPYPNVVVHLTRPTYSIELGRTLRSFIEMRSDTTDKEGRFEFRWLGPIAYWLNVYPSFIVSARADSVELKRSDDTIFVELRSHARYRSRETPDSVRTQRLAELAEARARWESRRVPRYQLAAEIICYCLVATDGKAILEFRNDSIVRVDGHRVRGTQVRPPFESFSVPLLFKQVQEAIRNRDRIVEAIEYDATYGFPTRLDTDTAYGVMDAYYKWRVSEFRPTP